MTSFREDVEAAIQMRLMMIVPDEFVDKVPQWAASIALGLPPQVYEEEGPWEWSVRRVWTKDSWIEEFVGTQEQCEEYLQSVYDNHYLPKNELVKMVDLFRRRKTEWKKCVK